MFEKEIKVIYDFSINEVRQLGSFFTYEELTSVDLHPAILKYVSAELDYLIYEDRYRLLSNSNFDYSGGRIAEYFALIGEEIKRSKKFAFDYADNLILQAIAFNVNFLAQPNWALTKLIFEKENEVKAAELRQIINYLYFNDYLKAIIEKYLQKKNLQIISRQEFETILDKIDRELLATDPSKVFNLVMRAIGEFFNIGSVLKSRIPLYPFKLYLKEKKLQPFAVKLENAFRGEAKQSCDIVELQNVLFAPEVKRPVEQKAAEQKPIEKKPLVPKNFVPKPWEQIPSVKKPVEQKPPEEKPLETKLSEQKTSEDKSFAEKPLAEKPFELKPEVPKPEVAKPEAMKPPVEKPVLQNRENYLDRIMRQEKPATFFSFGNPGEEAKEEKISPEEEKIPQALEIPAETDIPAEATDLPEDAELEAVIEEESIILELPEEENAPSELEFEEVEETEAAQEAEAEQVEVDNEPEPEVSEAIAAEPAAEPEPVIARENTAQTADPEDGETDELFSGINIDNIDIEITEGQEDKESEESASGFFKRFRKKSRSVKENKKLEDFSIGEFKIDDTGITIEDGDPDEVVEAENGAAEGDPVDTFSRVFSVISEVFSKKEQQKIISEIFSNKAEKFAKAFYNIITEAHDALQADGLIETVLRSNGIDPSDKWARVFKKNILKYFNQD